MNKHSNKDTQNKEAFLSRYTTWQTFKYWLENNVVLFGIYAHWEDKSDAAILNAYAKHIKKQVRAICLLDRGEELQDCFLHWKNYANEKDAIRIDFDKSILLNALKNNKEVEIRKGKVEYPDNDRIKILAKDTENIPFLKRMSYEGDREYRIICMGKTNAIKKGYPYEYKVRKDFFKNCIKGVRFNQSIHYEKEQEIRTALSKYNITEDVYVSKIIRNENWESMVLKGINNSTKGVQK